MAKYIDKEQVELTIKQARNDTFMEEAQDMADYIADQIDELQSIDVCRDGKALIVDCEENKDIVEVVRCRDCKHYNSNGLWCNILSTFIDDDGNPCDSDESLNWRMFDDDDFCSYGERKEDTDND